MKMLHNRDKIRTDDRTPSPRGQGRKGSVRPSLSTPLEVSRGEGEPERTCLGCGKKAPKRRLLRLVRSPQGTLSIDFQQRLPGRGGYLCLTSPACLTKALRREGKLHRSLGIPLVCPSSTEMIEQIRTFYEARVYRQLGLAKRAQALHFRREEVKRAIGRNEVVLVVAAHDASERMRADFQEASLRKGIEFFEFGDIERLGKALGRTESVSIVGLLPRLPFHEVLRQALTIWKSFSVEVFV